MKAIVRFFVAATLAFMLSVPTNVFAGDHGSSSSGGGIRRPRAICGAWGCYVFPKGRRWRAFSLNLSIGYGGWGYNAYGYRGYYPYYGGYGYGYGYGYGPYPPGDYRNAYAGLFGRYMFPPAY